MINDNSVEIVGTVLEARSNVPGFGQFGESDATLEIETFFNACRRVGTIAFPPDKIHLAKPGSVFTITITFNEP
jgi:hypothetical protein